MMTIDKVKTFDVRRDVLDVHQVDGQRRIIRLSAVTEATSYTVDALTLARMYGNADGSGEPLEILELRVAQATIWLGCEDAGQHEQMVDGILEALR